MISRLRLWIIEFIDIDPKDRLKVSLLALIYGVIVGAYTIARELKNSVFVNTVGKEYIPLARWFTMIALIPAILFYSGLVDRMRRHQLLCFYSIFFGVTGIIFSLLIGHPTIGLLNTDTSCYRLFGWLFYCFVEGFSPFLVGVVWAFANSVSDPVEAKKGYPLLVAGSKIGGIICAGGAWMLCSIAAHAQQAHTADVINYQIMLGISSTLLLIVPLLVMLLIKKVPKKNMHGYETAYQVEKQKRRERSQEGVGIFAGLSLLLKYPYVLGIFSMVFFYDSIDTILSFVRVSIAHDKSASLSQAASFLFETAFQAHVVGLFFALFGTKTLLRLLGERICLLLIPLIIGGALLMFILNDPLNPPPAIFMVVIVILKVIHYAFSSPVRESLYIPTVKEIKFKSKSWIDAFGGKFAKSSGSIFNFIITLVGDAAAASAYSFVFAAIIGLWFVTAYLLGKRFDEVVANNEVIGSDEEEVQIAKDSSI